MFWSFIAVIFVHHILQVDCFPINPGNKEGATDHICEMLKRDSYGNFIFKSYMPTSHFFANTAVATTRHPAAEYLDPKQYVIERELFSQTGIRGTRSFFTDNFNIKHVYIQPDNPNHESKVFNQYASFHIKDGYVRSYSFTLPANEPFSETFSITPTEAEKRVCCAVGIEVQHCSHMEFIHLVQTWGGVVVPCYMILASKLDDFISFSAYVDKSTGSLVALFNHIKYASSSFQVIQLPNSSPDQKFTTVSDRGKRWMKAANHGKTLDVLLPNNSIEEYRDNSWSLYIGHSKYTAKSKKIAFGPFVKLPGTILSVLMQYLSVGVTPENIKSGSIQMFYTVNHIRDIFFEYGFNLFNGRVKYTLINPLMENRMRMGGYMSTKTNLVSDSVFNFLWQSNYDDIPRSGSMDNMIIIHEITHGLTDKLTGGQYVPFCVVNEEAAGISEGISDFMAIMMTRRKDDNRFTDAAFGWYVGFTGRAGKGIRRYPYSTNMKTNPLTYASIDRKSVV